MTKQFFKTVLAGILAGVLIFMMPFILIKVMIMFFLIKAIFRLIGGGRHRRHWQYAYAHKHRHMSEEDRKAFMEKYGDRCGRGFRDNTERSAPSENKEESTGN